MTNAHSEVARGEHPRLAAIIRKKRSLFASAPPAPLELAGSVVGDFSRYRRSLLLAIKGGKMAHSTSPR